VYGETDKDVVFVDASLDGSTAYLQSEEQMTADDTNLRPDGFRVHPPAPGAGRHRRRGGAEPGCHTRDAREDHRRTREPGARAPCGTSARSAARAREDPARSRRARARARAAG
jgi:hypothetical protein